MQLCNLLLLYHLVSSLTVVIGYITIIEVIFSFSGILYISCVPWDNLMIYNSDTD